MAVVNASATAMLEVPVGKVQPYASAMLVAVATVKGVASALNSNEGLTSASDVTSR